MQRRRVLQHAQANLEARDGRDIRSQIDIGRGEVVCSLFHALSMAGQVADDCDRPKLVRLHATAATLYLCEQRAASSHHEPLPG